MKANMGIYRAMVTHSVHNSHLPATAVAAVVIVGYGGAWWNAGRYTILSQWHSGARCVRCKAGVNIILATPVSLFLEVQ